MLRRNRSIKAACAAGTRHAKDPTLALPWPLSALGCIGDKAASCDGSPWHMQKRFMGRERKTKRLRMHSYDLMISREKHVRQAMLVKDLMIVRPGHTISMHELREECDKLGIKARRLYYLFEFYETIFQSRVDRRRMEWIEFGEDGRRLVELEKKLLEEYEPLLVENLRKLLMMSNAEMICLKKIAHCREFLGLPHDFEENLVHKYPQYFEVVIAKDRMFREPLPFLKLTSWDPLLAVPRREADAEESERDPWSFRIKFPGDKRLNNRDRLFIHHFQELKFPSPYEPGHGYPSHSREAVKRAVAVIHEFLSLTQDKRAYVDCVATIRRDTGIPKKVGELLCRYTGIFYLSMKASIPRHPSREVVYLKEAYRKPAPHDKVQCAKLIQKGPLVQVKDAFASTMWHSDKAYDRKHGTNSFLLGRPFPEITFEAFQSTFLSSLYTEQKLKYDNM